MSRVPGFSRCAAEGVEELGIVVNDEDPNPLVCHWGIPRRAGHTIGNLALWPLHHHRRFQALREVLHITTLMPA